MPCCSTTIPGLCPRSKRARRDFDVEENSGARCQWSEHRVKLWSVPWVSTAVACLYSRKRQNTILDFCWSKLFSREPFMTSFHSSISAQTLYTSSLYLFDWAECYSIAGSWIRNACVKQSRTGKQQRYTENVKRHCFSWSPGVAAGAME